MTTSFAVPPDDRSINRVRHDVRLRGLEVIHVSRVTPHLIRITLGGETLQGFTSLGFDDHVKVFIPDAATGYRLAPTLGPNGLQFDPDLPKPAMRDYTPHHHDPLAQTLQLDFALHDAGPATAWALDAKPGDTLMIGGPKGSQIIGTGFDAHLLIGDDTAVPAIRRRLSELPAGARAVALIEVSDAADEEPIACADGVEVRWVHRMRSNLHDALQAMALPEGAFHAWVACESAEAKRIRSTLLERGADRAALKTAGYWRRGAAATHEVHD